jgi:hypothetical protein
MLALRTVSRGCWRWCNASAYTQPRCGSPRRAGGIEEATEFQAGPFPIDLDRHDAKFEGGRPLHLAPRE